MEHHIIREVLQNLKKLPPAGITVPVTHRTGEEIKQKHVDNAGRKFAPGLNAADVAVFCDTTIFGSGKEGIIFTGEGIYNAFVSRSLEGFHPLRWDQIRSATWKESHLQVTFISGETVDTYSSIYAGFVATAIERVLEKARDGQKQKEEAKPAKKKAPETAESAARKEAAKSLIASALRQREASDEPGGQVTAAEKTPVQPPKKKGESSSYAAVLAAAKGAPSRTSRQEAPVQPPKKKGESSSYAAVLAAAKGAPSQTSRQEAPAQPPKKKGESSSYAAVLAAAKKAPAHAAQQAPAPQGQAKKGERDYLAAMLAGIQTAPAKPSSQQNPPAQKPVDAAVKKDGAGEMSDLEARKAAIRAMVARKKRNEDD